MPEICTNAPWNWHCHMHHKQTRPFQCTKLKFKLRAIDISTISGCFWLMKMLLDGSGQVLLAPASLSWPWKGEILVVSGTVIMTPVGTEQTTGNTVVSHCTLHTAQTTANTVVSQ